MIYFERGKTIAGNIRREVAASPTKLSPRSTGLATPFWISASPSTIFGTELLVNESFERRLCLVLIKPDKML
jgi:hypothetical protein